MFSKSKINDPIDPNKKADADHKPAVSAPVTPAPRAPMAPAAAAQAPMAAGRQPKPAPSIISADLTIKGNLETTGDMQIEGKIEGDIRSHLLTIGQNAVVRGEIVADDVVVNGRVIGRIRGQKIRLSSTARVEGDILHKNIAIESGAQFEGSVQRSEDPIGQAGPQKKLSAPAFEANGAQQPLNS
ncbi:MAG: polymer-forming cytoskeletal protein [Neomegalonema sp.]|nr:polymer-forming cytoskeletal protein [Neomegalonema sp.]